MVMAPGKGRTKADFLNLSPSLHERGYDLLLFDPRNTGESEGDKWGFGYFESRDILAGIEFSRQEYGDDSFGVLGVSTGASAALMAALTTDEIAPL
ncbi:MAG: alpha/beta hydrolase [Candidatus Acetothermia bacterium]